MSAYLRIPSPTVRPTRRLDAAEIARSFAEVQRAEVISWHRAEFERRPTREIPCMEAIARASDAEASRKEER